MRVISGAARGKKLLSLDGLDTRPTTDRVKESVFNIVMPYVREANVLDLFAGSGALGIEALSRGAERCTFVEKNNAAAEIIRKNLEGTHLAEKAVLCVREAEAFLQNTEEQFDMIFLDPPYDGGFYVPVLDTISRHQVLAEDGILLLEKRADMTVDIPAGLTLVKERKYGKTAIAVIALRKED